MSEGNKWGIIEQCEASPPDQFLAAVDNINVCCLLVVFTILCIFVPIAKSEEKQTNKETPITKQLNCFNMKNEVPSRTKTVVPMDRARLSCIQTFWGLHWSHVHLALVSSKGPIP